MQRTAPTIIVRTASGPGEPGPDDGSTHPGLER